VSYRRAVVLFFILPLDSKPESIPDLLARAGHHAEFDMGNMGRVPPVFPRRNLVRMPLVRNLSKL